MLMAGIMLRGIGHRAKSPGRKTLFFLKSRARSGSLCSRGGRGSAPRDCGSPAASAGRGLIRGRRPQLGWDPPSGHCTVCLFCAFRYPTVSRDDENLICEIAQKAVFKIWLCCHIASNGASNCGRWRQAVVPPAELPRGVSLPGFILSKGC